jgi:hypothetical protein
MQAVSGPVMVARCISHEYRDTFSPLPRLRRDFDIVDDQVFWAVPQQKLSQQSAASCGKCGGAKIVVQKEQTMTTYLEGKCSLVQEALDTGAVGAYP